MATKNRRVAAYLPPAVDKAFIDFKIKNDLATEDSPHQNDSQALIKLLSELLGVNHEVNHSVSRQLDIETAIQIEDLKAELVSQISELSSELLNLRNRVELLEASQGLSEGLSTGEMANRIGIASSTLSHWKKDKSPQELSEAIQARDPERVKWIYIRDRNCFKRESDIPSVLQGSLLGL
jgi:DNA-binding transcriptional regulator YiaG